MAVVYTQQEQSLLGGLSKTFDGEHPCCLCEVVKAAQESEREQDLPAEPTHQKDVKLVQALVSGEFVLPQYPSGGFDRSPWKLGEPCTQGLAPLEQPPQVA